MREMVIGCHLSAAWYTQCEFAAKMDVNEEWWNHVESEMTVEGLSWLLISNERATRN